MNLGLPLITFLVGCLALIIAAYCLWQTISLNKLRKKFFAGTNGDNLEGLILTLEQRLKDSDRRQETIETELVKLSNNTSLALHKVGLVRFNPFNDGGGNFSFSLALLDTHNSGVIITSMYGREQNRVYTKKIDEGRSETQLTDEELQAVNLANSKYQNLKAK